MKLVERTISIDELKKMSEKMFGDLVKAVVDVEKEIMVVDAAMHSDEEFMLLEKGSSQKYLWGINIYPEEIGSSKWIVFDSMINLRPSWGNKSRGVDDLQVQEKIKKIVNRLVTK